METVLGLPLFLGYLALPIWIVAASRSMLRPRSAKAEAAPALT